MLMWYGKNEEVYEKTVDRIIGYSDFMCYAFM